MTHPPRTCSLSLLLVLCATGCGNDVGLSGLDDKSTPEPSSTSEPLTSSEIPTVDTATTTWTYTTDTTDTGSTGTTAPTVPLVTCDRTPDAGALADCTGNAAVLNGSAYDTVEAAIAAAGSGDRIWVCPGSWPTNAVLQSRTLELWAADPTPGATVLSGSGSNTILTISGGTITVDGLEISDGFSDYAGGGISASSADLTLTCVDLVDNYADYEGGGLYVGGGTVTIEGCTLRDNRSGYEGGGMEIDGGSPSEATITDSVFVGNRADYSGGALSVGSWAHDRLTLTRVDFDSNRSGYEGGAIAAGSWESVSLSLEEGTLSNNQAPQGGAIHLSPDIDANLTLTRTVLTDNQAGSGAALEVTSRTSGGTVLFDEVTLWSNTSSSQGNAAVILEGGPGFECISCDLGTGASDNSPNDVRGHGQTVNQGAGASFTLP